MTSFSIILQYFSDDWHHVIIKKVHCQCLLKYKTIDTPKIVNIFFQRFDYLTVIIRSDAGEIWTAIYTRGIMHDDVLNSNYRITWNSLEAFVPWLSVGFCRWMQRTFLKSSNYHCMHGFIYIIRELFRMIRDKMVGFIKMEKASLTNFGYIESVQTKWNCCKCRTIFCEYVRLCP